jgi:serine/threonine protein kinase
MVAPPAALVLDDRYELGDLLGRGAMGEVHRAWDRRLDRPVAVKRLRRDLAADPTVRARFEEEARAAAGLAHPNIVTVYDTGEADGVPYFVMACLPGRTLADDIAAGPLPDEEVAAIGIDLAGALAAAHAAGILHRDVKPANVLRTDAGGVQLADFGIAKTAESVGQLTVTGTVLGSPAYLAPERLEGRPATEASDVYALAVVLDEALTGACPFQGDTPMAVAHAVSTRAPAPIAERRPGVDPALARAIGAAMAKDPAARPPSAAAFADLLRGAPAPLDAPEPRSTGGTQVLPVATTATTVVHLPEPDGEPDVEPDVEPDAAPETAAEATRAGPPRPASGWRPSPKFAAAVAAAVVVLLLAWVAVDDDGAGEAPALAEPAATTAPASPLPEPLDDALRELEEVVAP